MTKLIPNSGLEAAKKAVQEAEDLVTRLRKEQKRLQGESLLRCGRCCSVAYIKDLNYIQTHWYVSGDGHGGGDYWNEGEGQWKCPLSGHVNRLYDNPEVRELKNAFKSVVKTYDR